MPEPTDSRSIRRRPTARRATAATLATVLACAAAVPPLASAREAESEGEGSGPPGLTLPGLEEGFEPGGEETGLEEVGPEPGEEEAEEAPPVEGAEEAPQAPAGVEEVTPPGPEALPQGAEVTLPAEEAPPPATTGPVYEAAEEAVPSYEAAAPPPPVEAVRGEAIVAPGGPRPKATPARSSSKTEVPSAVVEVAPGPEPIGVPEEPSVSSAPAVISTAVDRPGSLTGRASHTVAPGECLWSIAEAVLPAGASDARIAAEVSRLWRLNAARIGTGDPSLILVGTVLRLG